MNRLMTAGVLSMTAGLAMAQGECCEKAAKAPESKVIIEAVADAPAAPAAPAPRAVRLTEVSAPLVASTLGSQPEAKSESRIVMIQQDDDHEIKVEIINGDVKAWVNGDRVPKRHVEVDDDTIIIVDGEGNVVGKFQYKAGGGIGRGGGEHKVITKLLGGDHGEGEHEIIARIIGGDNYAGDGRIVWESDDGSAWTTSPPRGKGGNMVFAQPAGDHPPVMIGINMGTLDDTEISDRTYDILEEHDIDADEVILVMSVIDGLPAAKAGLREGDLIVRLGDEWGVDGDDLREFLSDCEPGDEIEVGFVRNGRLREAKIGLVKWNAEKLGVPSANIEFGDSFEFENPMTYEWRSGGEHELLLEKLHEHLGDLGEHEEELHLHLEKLLDGMKRSPEAQRFQFDVMPRIQRLRPQGEAMERLLVQPAPRALGGSGLEGRLDRLEERLDRLEGRIDRLLKALEDRD